MGNVLRTLAALGMAAALSLGAVPVMAQETLIGIFQTKTGLMDYRATLCGDGTQLCVQLVELRGKQDNATNRKYLNDYIVKELRQVRNNVWRGPVTFQGETVNGDITLKPGKELFIKACAYVVVCRDITLVYAAQ